MSENIANVEDPDSPEIEYYDPKHSPVEDNIPNSITDIQIKKWEKDEQIAKVNTITPKKAYMLDDDQEALDFPAEAGVKTTSSNTYSRSRKSVSTNNSEILIDLRSKSMF